jgi:hypothetical protein
VRVHRDVADRCGSGRLYREQRGARRRHARCRENGGAAGVDGQKVEDIENYGVQKWLGELAVFSFSPDEAVDPMTAACAAVHARYALDPLFLETLNTEGYSLLRYAPGPYRIGFFRVAALRSR